MTDQTQLNGHQTKYVETPGKITYHQYGFRSAEHSKSNHEATEGFLDNVYEKFLNEQKLDEQGLRDRVSKLQAELQQERSKKNDINANLSSTKILKEDKEIAIQEFELERIDIRNGEEETGDTIPFVISTFITILLTMYLFVFYSSSGYSAFYGIKSGSLGFINPNAYAEASNKGPGVISLIILFPVIFLGLGFLIHESIETNKKLLINKTPQKYLTISLLLFITLIADAFIGYKISYGIHLNEFNAGQTNELWKFSMIFSDINFYLVLVLGFVVYVIWGFLLNFVLSHPYLKTENERIKLLVENISIKITEKRNDLSNIITRTHQLESDLINCDNNIKQKEKDIIGYENGDIPVNIPLLRANVGEFMGGWQTFTNGYWGVRADEFITKAENIKNNWLNEKIQNLNSNN